MAGSLPGGGVGKSLKRRGAIVRWLGTACLLLMGAAGIYLIVMDDPTGGEPVAVAQIGSKPASSSSDEAMKMRPSVERDESVDPLPPGHDVAPADIVIRDPMSGSDTASSSSTAATAPAGSDGLVEDGPHGPLPKVAPDGRTPATAYAEPPPVGHESRRRIAIVIGGMGLSTQATERAIAELPSAVTLAFAPYGREVNRLAGLARDEGHEVLLQVPMEPYDFPDNDPGPQTLLTGLDAEQNLDRLHWSMGRLGGYVGVTNYMGARFSGMEDAMRPFLEEVKSRGLVYVDDGSSPRSLAAQIGRDLTLPVRTADLVLDSKPQKEAIRQALTDLEELSADLGTVVGVATGLPVTIDTIAAWAEGLDERGAVLVPVTTAVGASGS